MRLLSFKDFYLDEALNKPVNYYLTNDTDIPKKLYGAFDIDGMKYVIVMAQSKIPKVYYMEIGRTKPDGGKVMWWRFHSPKHIMPAISTLISFSDSAVQLLGKDKFDGVAIKLRKVAATKSIDRAVKIASRVIKTRFNNTLQMLPVSQETTGNQYGDKFIFVARKGKSYQNMFTGDKHFAGYDFNENPAVDTNKIDAAVKPKTVIKQTATTTPSTKYTFGQFDVDISPDVDADIVQKLSNIKQTTDDSSPDNKEKAEKEQEKVDNYEEDLKTSVGYSISEHSGMVQALPSMQSMVNALTKYGFDESKLNWGDLKYVVQSSSPAEKVLLKKAGLFDIEGSDSYGVKSKWKSVMKSIADPSKSNSIQASVYDTKKAAEDFLSKYPNGNISKPKPISSGTATIKYKKTSNVKPTDFISKIPGSSNEEVSINTGGPNFWGVAADTNKMTSHIFYDLDYNSELKNIPNFTKMVSYTGSQYSDYNDPLRNTISRLLKGEKLYAYDIENITKNTSKFMGLAKMFDKVKPLPEGMWVYRGTYLPYTVKDKVEPGFQFVDPAFLSTSLNPNISFGSDRMRIWLPKGSKVLPALNHSKHSNEKEIILPPSSVIKTIEVTRFDTPNVVYMQGVFMGSAFKSIVNELKEQLKKMNEELTFEQSLQLTRIIEQMNKENEKYDPEEKFGGSYDAEAGELINKNIENGKYQLEKPKSEK